MYTVLRISNISNLSFSTYVVSVYDFWTLIDYINAIII